MSNCLKCGARGRVIESRIALNGTRRQRLHCPACKFRWTVWLGPKPPQGRVPHAVGRTKLKPLLTEEQIRLVLTSPLSARKLARELNRTPESIFCIRRGQSYRHVAPELPRSLKKTEGPSCYQCLHWSERQCQIGFPDPVLEGPGFAADCNLYEASQSMSRS